MSIYNVLKLNAKLLAVLFVSLLIKSAYDRHACEKLSARLYQKRQTTLNQMLGDCEVACINQVVLLQRQLKLFDDAVLSQEGCAK